METRSLDGTLFELVYSTPLSNSDQTLLSSVTAASWIFVGLSVLFALFSSPSKPENSSNKSSEVSKSGTVSGSTFWRLGFLSTLIVPFALYYFTPSRHIAFWVNRIALAIYCVHYFNRCFIYSSFISDRPISSRKTIIFTLLTFCGEAIHTFFHAHQLLNVLIPIHPSIHLYAGVWLATTGEIINLYYAIILQIFLDKGPKQIVKQPGRLETLLIAEYFGDILFWWGFAVVTGSQLQMALAAIATVVHSLELRSTVWDGKHIQNKSKIQ